MAQTPPISRRELLKLSAAGVVGYSLSGWMEALADQATNNPQRRRSCILLWMNGGPSQTDTFDMKPDHANGGQFRPIQTNVTGIQISEHLPRLARNMDKMAIIRSMTSREGDHGRGTFLMRTGYLPQGPVNYPTMGSFLSKEIGAADAPLPNFVSIAPYRLFNQAAFGSGFLGPQYAPLIVGEAVNQFGQPNQQVNYEDTLRVQDMVAPDDVAPRQLDSRIGLLQDMERDFVTRHPGVSPQSHSNAYDRAVRLMRTAARAAFNLSDEPERLRDAYGRNLFGQGCLLARRLVERGVAFVEVSLGNFLGNNLANWDSHNANFQAVRSLSQVLDPAWATLMEDLQTRGLLDSTMIVWMGEFGRTPNINQQQGRDHYPNAWTTVLAGGGIRGGQVYGGTTANGMNIDTQRGRAVNVPDFMATICRGLGINPDTSNMSNVGRPIRVADHGAQAIRELIA